MPRRLGAILMLALCSLCWSQDRIYQSGFDVPPSLGCSDMTTRQNLAISISPPAGASDLKLRMAVDGVPVRKGEPLFGALIGQAGTPPYVYSIVDGSLPTGVSLNSSTGALSGTPTVVGHYSFLAEVQDFALGVFTCRFAINVIPPLTFVASTPIDIEKDNTYGYQFAISGATGAVTFAKTGGTLPTGLSVDSAGNLAGLWSFGPAGVYSFVVTATDGGSGDSVDAHCTITGWDSIGSSAGVHIQATVGIAFTASLSITGGRPPYVYSLGTIPANLTLSVDASGTIRGSATALVGTTTSPESFDVTIVDSLGFEAFQTCFISAVNPNQLLQPQHVGVDIGDAGAYKYNFTGTGVTSVTNDGETVEVQIDAGGGSSTHANVAASTTLSATTNRYTAGSVAGTTPASPADFAELETVIEDASFTGCSLVANSGQTVNGGASFTFDTLPSVIRWRYNLASTNWFPLYYRIGTL